jgi:hypothetical protein
VAASELNLPLRSKSRKARKYTEAQSVLFCGRLSTDIAEVCRKPSYEGGRANPDRRGLALDKAMKD